MTDNTTCPCPSCGYELSLRGVQGPARVTCPECSHKVLLGVEEPPLESDEALPGSPVFDDMNLPQPIVVSEPVAPPSKRNPLVAVFKRKKRKPVSYKDLKERRIRIAKRIGIVTVGLIIVLVIGNWTLTRVREIPKDSWATVIPGMQTPEKFLREYEGICKMFHTVSDTVDNAIARNQAIPQFNVVAARLRGFPSRIAEAGRPTQKQLGELGVSYHQKIDSEAEKVQQKIDQLRKRTRILSGELLASLGEVSNAIEDAKSAMKIAWRDIPVPRNKSEELEREVVLIHANLWCAVTAVNDEIAYADLATDFVLASSELNAIRSKLRKQPVKIDRDSYFLSLKRSYANDIDSRLAKLEDRFGSIRAPRALQRYRDASVEVYDEALASS